jgi:hypothetical protein
VLRHRITDSPPSISLDNGEGIVKSRTLLLAIAATLSLMSASANADPIDLWDYGLNIDGTVSVPTLGDPVPAEADISLFDALTGLGVITVDVIGAGAHFVDLFLDIELDEILNTWFNETGSAVGTAAADQTWEIDEPGFGEIDYIGDIFDNFMHSTLDGMVFYDGIFDEFLTDYGRDTDDVALAMGWDFVLAADEIATIAFSIGTTAPTSGFYLGQFDPHSERSVFLSSALSIEGGGTTVPEPGTLSLLGLGLIVMAGLRRRRFR